MSVFKSFNFVIYVVISVSGGHQHMPIIVLGSRIQKYTSTFFIDCTHVSWYVRQKIKLVTFWTFYNYVFRSIQADLFFLLRQYNEAGFYFGIFAIHFGMRDIRPNIILGYLKK